MVSMSDSLQRTSAVMTSDRSASTPAEFWNERYREAGFSFGEAPNAWLASERRRFGVGTRVLVPGDGEGRNGVFLAECGARVTTVDASPIGVHKAGLLAAERGVTIEALAADLTQWAWPVATFDAVVSIYVHWPASHRQRMHKAMADALVPGGYILLEGYSPRHVFYQAACTLGGPRDVSMLFEPRDLAADFAGLVIERLDEVKVTLAEGKRHVGPSAIVRLIARKP
jgi:SAM-dependent methyltransferase